MEKKSAEPFYKGTYDDFYTIISPLLRNTVQKSIAGRYKKQINQCEFCKTKENLEAAHKKGFERKQLAKKAYKKVVNKDTSININVFKEEFKRLHHPVEDVFFILCRKCHKEYDAKNKNK